MSFLRCVMVKLTQLILLAAFGVCLKDDGPTGRTTGQGDWAEWSIVRPVGVAQCNVCLGILTSVIT